MYNELKDLLFSPRVFFSRKTGSAFDLRVPVIIVLAGGILGLISPYIIRYFSHEGLAPVNAVVPVFAFLLYILGPFVAWFLFSCILYGICKLFFSGTGTFILTLQNTGYAVLPLTIISLVPLIQALFFSKIGEIPGTYDVLILFGFNILSLLFIIWTGYLWACAMEKTHDITRGRSLVAASVTVLIYLVYHVIVLYAMASRLVS